MIVKYENVKLTEILVKYLVNLDKKNVFGETALHHAVNNLDKENINLLLKNKCNPLIKNYKDLSVIDLLEKAKRQLFLEFKSLKYPNNNLVFYYVQKLSKIDKIKEQISIYIKKYWYDIEMKEIKFKIETGIDVLKNIDEINSNSQDLQNQSLTSSTKTTLTTIVKLILRH